jgi:hypothetical protein
MATQDQIEALKLLLGGGGDINDEQLAYIIDYNLEDMDASAAYAWEIRAAKYHGLVNVSESGSSRSLGDMYKNAIAMAMFYRGKKTDGVVDPDDPPAGRTRTGRIVRA